MSRAVLVAFLLLIVSHPAVAQNAPISSPVFRWLNSGKDAALFDRIKSAFSDELKPDDPEKVKPTVAQGYKWVSRIGVFDTSALVLIGERETRTATYGDYFEVFNYDLKRREKAPITSFNHGFTVWKFEKLIRFDSSKTPDIVFSHFSCTECEAERLLGSFRLDSMDAKWKVRTWGKDTEILVGRDFSVGTDENSKDECLFNFADFTGDGVDDLAVRCLTVSDKGKVLDDITTVYTVQRGQPQVLTIKDRDQLALIRKKLCMDAKNLRLCPSK